jgi:hypothetical protein
LVAIRILRDLENKIKEKIQWDLFQQE